MFRRIVFISFTLFLLSDSIFCQKSTNNIDVFEPSFKEQDSKIEFLDNKTKVYSSYKYGFTVDFPDNWTIDRGVSKHTIIRGVQKDSAISFSINVIEVKNIKSTKNTWEFWDKNLENFRSNQFELLSQALNSKLSNYKNRKVYIYNTPAIETTFNFTNKNIDLEFEIDMIMYSVMIDSFKYTITLSLPQLIYNENPFYFKSLIRNFKFLNQLK